jgi:hypothetical protein
MKHAFEETLASRIDGELCKDACNESVSPELVSRAISKLHLGKASGFDTLQTEHLINAHPILHVVLSKLFNFMLKCEHVPKDFGRGLLIPIPKETEKRV